MTFKREDVSIIVDWLPEKGRWIVVATMRIKNKQGNFGLWNSPEYMDNPTDEITDTINICLESMERRYNLETYIGDQPYD